MSNHRADVPLALIVEDEALIAMELEGMLVADGFACVTASNRHAVEVLPLDDFAVAVVNLNLHGCIEGQTIIRYLRKRMRHLPVVVVTGYTLPTSEADLRGLGGPTIRLGKPTDPIQLRQAVQDVIDRRKRGDITRTARRRDDGMHFATC